MVVNSVKKFGQIIGSAVLSNNAIECCPATCLHIEQAFIKYDTQASMKLSREYSSSAPFCVESRMTISLHFYPILCITEQLTQYLIQSIHHIWHLPQDRWVLSSTRWVFHVVIQQTYYMCKELYNQLVAYVAQTPMNTSFLENKLISSLFNLRYPQHPPICPHLKGIKSPIFGLKENQKHQQDLQQPQFSVCLQHDQTTTDTPC